MDSIFKTFLGVFLLFFTIILGTLFLSASITANSATSNVSNYTQKIEASNGATSVINECKTDAESKFGENALSVDIKKQNGYTYGTIILKYKYEIPILKISEEKHVISYIN